MTTRIDIDADVAASLKRLAMRDGVSLSDLLREWVEQRSNGVRPQASKDVNAARRALDRLTGCYEGLPVLPADFSRAEA